jgi:hypothetical protein
MRAPGTVCGPPRLPHQRKQASQRRGVTEVWNYLILIALTHIVCWHASTVKIHALWRTIAAVQHAFDSCCF